MDTSLDFLNSKSEVVAPRLLDCLLERRLDGQVLRARIVETESYDQADEASHSFRGQTPRTSIMFGPSGHLYVYFTYGMHYCCNVVVGPSGYGSAVLIRAVEPLDGEDLMQRRRGRGGLELTNGPAKLCQAMGIDKQLNGHNLTKAPLKLIAAPALKSSQITRDKRIGISKAQDKLLRFYVNGNPYVSKA